MVKAGGRIAGYVIHTPQGLRREDECRAAELGPSAVAAPALPEDLAKSVGFSVIRREDVTARFRTTCEAIVQVRTELEGALRAAGGFLQRGTQRGKADAVSADGRALPFRPACFDAVVHADVFC